MPSYHRQTLISPIELYGMTVLRKATWKRYNGHRTELHPTVGIRMKGPTHRSIGKHIP